MHIHQLIYDYSSQFGLDSAPHYPCVELLKDSVCVLYWTVYTCFFYSIYKRKMSAVAFPVCIYVWRENFWNKINPWL